MLGVVLKTYVSGGAQIFDMFKFAGARKFYEGFYAFYCFEKFKLRSALNKGPNRCACATARVFLVKASQAFLVLSASLGGRDTAKEPLCDQFEVQVCLNSLRYNLFFQ